MIEKVIERLANGEVIENYKESGNSMTPILKSRQPVHLAPVDPEMLESGDIVLCKVKGRIFTHLVVTNTPGRALISNNHGHINGWAKWKNIYGIVTHIDGVPRSSAKGKTL